MKRIIRAGQAAPEVLDDHWVVVRDLEGAQQVVHATLPKLLPLPIMRSLLESETLFSLASTGVWIGTDDEFEDIASELMRLPVIAVDFPSFRDGRGYSVAYLLRTRYGYQGELRAIGDVLRDQLFYMHRCGFDAFEVRADKDIEEALKGLSAYSIRYQGAVDDPVPLFRKRAEAPSATPDEHWEP